MPDRLESLAEPNDEMLAARVRHHDVAAFTLLYDRHAPAVYALAAHLLDATTAEEDCAGNIFALVAQGE